MTQTDNVAETNHPEQPGNAWVRSTFYGLATRTVVVRCPLCHHDHPHHWQYESGDEDPGERQAPCGRGQYVVGLRRAVQERLPNKPPPHPAPARSSATGTTPARACSESPSAVRLPIARSTTMATRSMGAALTSTRSRM